MEDEDDGRFDETFKEQLLEHCQLICASLIGYCTVIMTSASAGEWHPQK